MSGSSVQVSRESIKTSYLRFLSDSAPGYVLILVVMISKPAGASLWFEGSAELVTFFCVLIFVLATPVGLLLNSLSWFLLGAPQAKLANFLVRDPLNFLTASTRAAYRYDDLAKYFGLDRRRKQSAPANGSEDTKREGLFEVASYFEEALRAIFPEIWSAVAHVVGIKQLARSSALISLFVFLYSLPSAWADIGTWAWLVAAVLLLTFSSILEYYEDVAMLATVMHLHRLACPSTSPAVSGAASVPHPEIVRQIAAYLRQDADRRPPRSESSD